jgi:hypothetical protein
LMQIRKATIRESLSSFQGGTPSWESIEDPKCNISMIQSD